MCLISIYSYLVELYLKSLKCGASVLGNGLRETCWQTSNLFRPFNLLYTFYYICEVFPLPFLRLDNNILFFFCHLCIDELCLAFWKICLWSHFFLVCCLAFSKIEIYFVFKVKFPTLMYPFLPQHMSIPNRGP